MQGRETVEVGLLHLLQLREVVVLILQTLPVFPAGVDSNEPPGFEPLFFINGFQLIPGLQSRLLIQDGVQLPVPFVHIDAFICCIIWCLVIG